MEKFLNPDDEGNEGIANRLKGIKKLDLSVFYPLLLRLYRGREQDSLGIDGLVHCLAFLESFYVRRLSQPGVVNLDARSFFFYCATGITPAMAIKRVGAGSQYAIAFVDADKNPLDGSKTYKLHPPPGIPAKDFWSFTVYENQTRSMLQTDQQFPAVSSENKSVVTNPDTSANVYFGPTPPAGHESNWVQTVPDKGWNCVLRL